MPPKPAAANLPPAGPVNDADPVRRMILAGMVGAAVELTAAGCWGGGDGQPRVTEGSPSGGPFGLPELDQSAEVDLLRTGTWGYMIGATVEGGTLKTHRTGEAVLMLDTPGRPPEDPQYQPNPPVNLFGSHVEMERDGDVGFVTSLRDIQGQATLSFLGAPSVRYDERIERQEGVDLVIDGSKVKVNVYDGSSHSPAFSDEIQLDAAGSSVDIALSQVGNEMHINANGKLVSIPAAVLKRQVWFGFDADATISQLKAYPVNGNSLRQVDMSQAFSDVQRSPNGLAEIVQARDRRKLVGTAVDLAELVANPQYAAFVVQNFNQLETENLAKFQALQPEEGKFEFAELDALVKFASDHGMSVHGHALLFPEAYPRWLSDKLQSPATTRDEAIRLLETHIKTVVSRYNGRNGHGEIKYWDVVNEWFDPDDWAEPNRQSLWYQKIGEEAAEIAFRAAREAHPGAVLFANDWGSETDPDRREAMIDWAVGLKRRGVPIHGVGLQAHFDEETLDDDEAMDRVYSGELEQTFARLDAAGLLVRISEASVAENGDPDAQADVYGMLMEAVMKANNATGINLWGASNSAVRYAYFTGSSRDKDPGNDAPTTQDASGRILPRRAWDALFAAARG